MADKANKNAAALRVHAGVSRPPEDLVAPFRDVPTGYVCDAIGRFGALDYRIQALDPSRRLCGPALTVRTRPGDNITIYKALQVARPGDVLVIATYEYPTSSTFGDLFVRGCKNGGLAGIVSDGLCRDSHDIRAIGLPVFVRGTSPASPFKHGPGEIGGPVSIGGVPVRAGDLVVGDEDGVAVVPLERLEEAAAALEGIRQKEEAALAALQDGRLMTESTEALLEEMSSGRVSSSS